MKTKKTGILNIIGYVFAVIGTIAVVLFITLYFIMSMICNGSSEAARRVFVSTVLETGQLKFLASWYLTEDEINSVVQGNSMGDMNETVDKSLIKISVTGTPAAVAQDPASIVGQAENNGASVIYRENVTDFEAGSVVSGSNTTSVANEEEFDENGVRVVGIAGRTFYGTLLIIKDPSKVSLACIYPWQDQGETLNVIVNRANAVAGINGGLYVSSNNSGGKPIGVVVSHGEILMNNPQAVKGLVLIGMTNDNILTIDNIASLSREDVVKLVKEKGIRDACCFQEESSDVNNHFVQLVINGQERELNGMGSGLNPRTVIGQRADGAILMLVTDGRGTAGHLGASASDLINIMTEYGAVNAANLDGGSSSSMYYNDEYLMTSVTFYYANESWRLPLAFVVEK